MHIYNLSAVCIISIFSILESSCTESLIYLTVDHETAVIYNYYHTAVLYILYTAVSHHVDSRIVSNLDIFR